MMVKKFYWIGMVIGWMGLLCGCTFMEASDKKVADLEFVVSDISELPEEIQKMIEEKQEKAFQMAYHNDTSTYIILGYGMQETSGYSIQVNDVYQGETGIWVDTDLIGPEKAESVENVPSYPYVVIKTEKINQTIRFNS